MSETRWANFNDDRLDAWVRVCKTVQFRMRWRGVKGKEVEVHFYRGVFVEHAMGVVEREVTAGRLPKRVLAWFLAVSELERSWQKRPRR